MQNLDIALGFATVMFFLATVVKFLSSWAESRRKHYRDMIDDFLANGAEAIRNGDWGDSKADGDKTIKDLFDEKAGEIKKMLGGVGKTGRTNIDIEEVMELLGNSSLGKSFRKKLGDEAEPLFASLRKNFERADADATEKFRRHKRVWNSVIGVIVALLFNIDALALFRLLTTDDAYRDQVISVPIDDVEAFRKQIEAKTGEDTTAQDAVGIITAGVGSEAAHDGVFTMHGEFPHWSEWRSEKLTREQKNARLDLGNWFLWSLGILLTGLLAGLGSPFWHDVIRGLTSIGAGDKARVGSGRSASRPVTPATESAEVSPQQA